MKNLLTSLGVEVEEGLKETQMHFYVYVLSPKFESFKNGYKNFFKKGRVLICVVLRKNFKFSDKNKKGKGKYINYGKFGYCQFNCSKKKNDNKPNNKGSKHIICVRGEHFRFGPILGQNK